MRRISGIVLIKSSPPLQSYLKYRAKQRRISSPRPTCVLTSDQTVVSEGESFVTSTYQPLIVHLLWNEDALTPQRKDLICPGASCLARDDKAV